MLSFQNNLFTDFVQPLHQSLQDDGSGTVEIDEMYAGGKEKINTITKKLRVRAVVV